jgi:hypothetical protein
MRNFDSALKQSNLVEGLDVRAQTAMYTEDLTFHDCPDAQIIEYFHLVFPSVRVAVLPHALIIKAIDTADLSGFMVAPEQGNVAWIPNLQTHQQLKSLH